MHLPFAMLPLLICNKEEAFSTNNSFFIYTTSLLKIILSFLTFYSLPSASF